MLIGSILKQLQGIIAKNPNTKTNDKQEKVAKLFKKFKKALTKGAEQLVITAVDIAAPGLEKLLEKISQSVKDVDVEEDGQQQAQEDLAELIVALRGELSSLVNEICAASEAEDGFAGPEKIVIFIDDLDRLEPEQAVVVMEAIKVFLDCENCVFVLAIDFGVVLRSARAKYGDALEEEKARAFFDKIIQVPFNLPVSAYKIDKLLQEGLNAIELSNEDKDREEFVELIKYSTGPNPRAVKRLINTFSLLS